MALVDLRRQSPTFGVKNTLYAGVMRPWQILIPPGIAHGYKVIGADPAMLVYVTGIAARITIAAGAIKTARIGVTGVARQAISRAHSRKLLEGTTGKTEDVEKASSARSNSLTASRHRSFE